MTVAMAAAWLSLGCGAGVAEAAFASDFNCETGVNAEGSAAPGRYVVEGCGRRATYQCVGNYESTCVLQAATEEPSSDAATHESRRERAPRRARPEVEVAVKDDGAVMKLELPVGKRALLRLTAMPEQRSDLVQIKLIRAQTDDDSEGCNLDFMLNGQVIKMPKSVATSKKEVVSHRVQIGRELISEFAIVSKVAMRVCDERYSLQPEQVAKVREFMERFQEEMAWQAPPRDGISGGMPAPTGGWPQWQASGLPPAAVAGTALDGRALFRKLSASVFRLEATLAGGTSQGSAVAVSPTELVTNCHVVQGAVKLVLRQDTHEWPASVLRADPRTDRCIVTAPGQSFVPVAGVRSYDSLEVGEPLYTLGSPVGLELTLASGILSGRREEDGRRFVQTTAPISPGSSGGGLFDARGNLVGVTTLVLAGRERLNQALNFALPADTFWQP
jgi:S1-C subfamily serine protease